jgi:CubicO group peptidase (beta-lactamase class C family)
MRDVHGYTAPGFDAVRDVLARASLDDGGAAFTAMHRGEVVVDVWAGFADDGVAWQRDTVACPYSCTKGMVTSCLVQLHADGLLDLDAPVADHWPEFAAAGKSAVTVRQLLSHTAGLPAVPGYQGWLGVYGEGWDQRDEIRARLAASAPAWEPGTESGYHGLTYGYLAGALVERITGLPMTEFFRKRLAEPLGLELWFGLDPAALDRRARQRRAAPLSPEVAAALASYQQRARDPELLIGQTWLAQDGTNVLEHLDEAGSAPAQMTCGSGNGDALGTARGLAALYAGLATGPLAESLRAFGEVQHRGVDLVLEVPVAWCVGFMGNAPTPTGALAMGPAPNAFGHHGSGGQLGGIDLESGLAFGFLRSQLSPVSTVARDLLTAVHEVLASR